MNSTRRYLVLFLAAILLGGGLRFYRLDWGRSEVFHPDEARLSYAIGDIDRQVHALRAKIDRGEHVTVRERIDAYNPRFFAYGSLPIYLIWSSHRILNAVFHRVWPVAGDLFVAGRAWSAFFDTLTILLTFLIGSRLFSRRAGCLASLFFAFTVFHIQLAHFLTVDVMLTSMILAAIYYCVRVMEEGRFRHYCLAGLFSGLALGTKFTALPILLPLGFAHVAYCWRQGRICSPAQWGKLVGGLIVCAALFAVCEPFFFFDHKEFMRQLREQRDMVQGRWAPPWTYQYAHTMKGLYQIKNFIAYCLGAPLGITVLAGAGYLVCRWLRKPDRSALLLMMWLVPVGGVTLSFQVKFLRYLAPLIPFLCILGAQGVCMIYEKARERGWGLALRAALGLVLGFSLFYSLAYVSIYRRENSRVTASQWIYKNIPKGSHILGETWEFGGLPYGTDEGNAGTHRYTVKQLDIYKPDDRATARYLARELAEGDLIALMTKRMYGSVLRVAERYPITSNYYRLLFAERLGYTLVKSVAARPRLWGISFNDDYADESFTVYDHPKVLLFRKVVNYPAEYIERLLRADPKIDYGPVLSDALGADEFNRPQRQPETAPSLEGYNPPRYSGIKALIIWLAMVELMGLLALPLTASFFSNLADRGYPFAKLMAITLAGYIVWITVSLGVARFSLRLILLSLALVLLLSWRRAAGECGWRAFFRLRRRSIIVSELIFLGAFGLFLLFRLYNPDIFWSESSMDFSFINSILRSRSFPPVDPWASGIYLNYYYYGHYLVAMLTKLSGIPSAISYNLCFCLIPALVISCVFSIVYTVTGRIRYGVCGGIFAGLMGNLDGFFLLIDTYPWREAFYRFFRIAMPTHHEPLFRFFRCAHEVIQHTVHEFPIWSFIFVDLHAHVIALPFGIFLLALGLNTLMEPRPAFGLHGRGTGALGNFFVSAVALGMMIPMNTWDFPTYLVLLALMLLARELLVRKRLHARVPIASYSIWWNSGFFGYVIRYLLSIIRGEGVVGAPLKVVVRTACPTVLLAVVALIAYSPFFQFFGRQGMGIGLVGAMTTSPLSLLRFFGFFIFIIASFFVREFLSSIKGRHGLFKGALFVLLILLAAAPCIIFTWWGTRDYAALSIALALLFTGLVVLKRNRFDRSAIYVLTIVLYGFSIIAFCEIFHIKDFLQGGEYKRMNTIFKFYMPVWFFFSIGGSYCLARIFAPSPYRCGAVKRFLSSLGGIIWCALFLVLLAASLVFTVMGPRARIIGDDNYERGSLEPPPGPLKMLFPKVLRHPTLNGLAYMRESMPDEYDAILWMNEKLKGQPVIAEATEGDYLYQYARISSNTGIPTVLGWWSHVDQRGYDYRDVRKNDVFNLYKSLDPVELHAIIAKYNVGYVFVGNTERIRYQPDQLEKFNELTDIFRPVFRNKRVTIYQTVYRGEAGSRPRGEKGEGAAPAMPAPAPPRVQMLEGEEGDAPGQYKEPRGIAVDNRGTLYVADFRNYRIQKFDSKGFFITSWGEEGNYPGQFNDPCGVAVDREGHVYVADTFNHRVQVFDANGKFLLHFEGGFFAPHDIAVDGKGRIWVADTGNGMIKIFSSDGKPLKVIGRKGSGEGEFNNPNSVAIDQKGKVYVADTGNKRVQILDREGNYVSEFKVDGWQQVVFNEPYLDIDDRGDIYLTDPPGNRILKYSQKGNLVGVLKPMEGAEPLISFPMGIAVEKKGEAIYVVDCRHHRIRKVSKKDFK